LPTLGVNGRVPVEVGSDIPIEVVWEAGPPLCLDILRDERRQGEEPWERLLCEFSVVGPGCPELVSIPPLLEVVFKVVSLV